MRNSTTLPVIRRLVCTTATALLLMLLSINPSAAREKRDIVVFENGDTITCEIKQLTDGILNCSTVGMGTAHVEWEHVGRISSAYNFRIRLSDGSRYFGSLESGAPPGMVRIAHAYGTSDVGFEKIVAIVINSSSLDLPMTQNSHTEHAKG